MNMGQLVEYKDITGFKGVLLKKLPNDVTTYADPPRQLELEFHEKWKVLWFKHPFENKPVVEEVLQHSLKRLEIEPRS